ncbi:efflux RND transporter permease subunit [Citrobacter freundii]|uniref:efflux RND transporter permease subunit n=1 Tax=Citrobacter freundii TaxID=546 RepID=UPI00124CB04D|nr:efflux RND transporter permease subunit [Citrobacter freundii]QFH77979.1 efflux RND transporter permease subunit [Citrobacter freundii]QFH83070.1 efflux RND transporter permease subunit [Citrobacter freundii]HAU4309600.1 efflux RND transporter permease subunit [Citrobacter freundii]HAU4312254.1 efflux RND transporter permease subunit [Citrobacter freundii]HCR3790676.1 efflux RND transporter permease subunit [Citrobacter freundii]
MKITEMALRASRLTYFVALIIFVAGIATFLNFPSQEEPTVTVRDAMVTALNPGLPAERVEQLIARPIEERLRELAEVKRVTSTVRAGSAMIQVTIWDRYTDLAPIWQRVRAKVADSKDALPQSTMGPFVDEDFGRVAVASIAVTAPGYSMSEMRVALKQMRDRLYTVPGIERITFYGLQEERVYLEFDRPRLARLELTPQGVIDQLVKQNVVASGGQIVVGGINATLAVSGEVRDAPSLRAMPIALPRPQSSTAPVPTIALGELAQVSVRPADPPESAAIYKGQPAVVMAVSMASGQNVEQFGKALKARVADQEKLLPAGFDLSYVTFQADVVKHEMGKMNHVMMETIIVVLGVVVLFLGWRTGIIVGMIVPLTILSALIVMRAMNIELQNVSMGAIIIALGLLVDNGIVIAEDIERRLAGGEDRKHACLEAGRTLAIPLLTSSLVIVIVFSPFFFGQNATSEYLHNLVVVLALTLFASWLLCLTVTPLLCYHFAKPHHKQEQGDAYDTRFYRGYRRVLEWVLHHKAVYVASMIAALAIALYGFTTLPYDFMPKSDRLQFQIPVQLAPGTDSRETLARTRSYFAQAHGDVRAEPKRFSLGATESGTAIYRVSGPDEEVLLGAASKIEAALRKLPGTINVKNDWDTRVGRIDVRVDQDRARRAGVTTEDIAGGLDVRYSGRSISVIRDGDTSVPIVLRSIVSERRSTADVGATLIYPTNGGPAVTLAQVADVSLASEPSVIQRRNLIRTITVQGQNTSYTAQEIINRLAPSVAALDLPAGYSVELGGEIEEAAESNAALSTYMPLAFLAMLMLFVWQFNSFRKLGVILATIPFTLIGVVLALKLTGTPFSFMATFGVLALFGIIVNNAVLLLERIDQGLAEGLPRHEALVGAAIQRLRPIVMTKVTCISGLVPLMLFSGPLWKGMAIAMIGGLALGTLVTLGLIPLLYEVLFGIKRIGPWNLSVATAHGDRS